MSDETFIPQPTESVLAKVQALYELAAHPNTGEAEAATARAMADKLITKYAIEAGMLSGFTGGKAQPDEVIRRDFVVEGQYVKQRVVLLYAIGQAFQCRGVQTRGSRAGKGYLTLIGTKASVEAVSKLYDLLVVQMANEAAKSMPSHYRGGGGADTVSWRTNFQKAFISRVKERLQEQYRNAKQEAVAEHGTGVSIALQDQAQRVASMFRKEFPHVRTSRSSTGSYGSGAGRSAGDRADIGNRQIGGRMALGRGG